MSILSGGKLVGDRYGSITWNVEEDGTVHLHDATFTAEGFVSVAAHLAAVASDAVLLHAIHETGEDDQ